ncbi:MAG: carbohydrate ABC transporter permease, partial [Coprobacillaceae bacterium]
LLLLSSMMIAGVTIMIPQFILLKMWPLAGGNNILGQGGFGLLNTYWAIILPGAAGAFAIFMMRQFFLKMPDELMESARIDGLSEFGIYRKIFLPLSKPALTTLALVTFQSGWNSFMWPLIVLSNKDLYTVQLGLSQFAFSVTNRNPDYGALMAGSIIAILPMLILFLFGNKYFVEGLSFSGSKE